MHTPSVQPTSGHRSLRLLVGGLLLGALMGCGYKGPLYLPAPEAPPAELTEPPVTGVAPLASEPAGSAQ